MCKSVLLCTRIHRKNAGKLDLSALVMFLERSERLPCHIAIAMDNTDKPLVEAVRGIVGNLNDNIRLLALPLWGNIVPALNTLLAHAREIKADCILFASVELEFGHNLLENLCFHLTQDTLVVGARLQGHDFSQGQHVLDGCTSPWNTCALWDVAKLSLTGFLSVADGLSDISPGVEEVVTIALLQQQLSHCMKAKLVKCPGINWITD
eukprot:Ihof_evm5s149 gene=Ihof_evmTU5s149